MAASVITRGAWTDDDGSGTTGTIVNNARLQSDVYDKIDLIFSGTGAYTTLTVGGKLRVEGAGLEVKSASAPAVSAASEGKIYFDTTQLKFLKSENGAPFVPLGLPAYADPLWLCGLDDNSGEI